MTSAPAPGPGPTTVLDDPYPLYARLQATNAVVWSENMGSWMVTRFAACQEVLNDPERFTQDRKRVSGTASQARQSLLELERAERLDVAGERALRRLIVTSIHERDQAETAASVRAVIDRLFAELRPRPSFDWMSEAAAPLAAAITAEVLGFREPAPGVFKKVSEGLARGYNADVNPENAAIGAEARARLAALIEDAWQAAGERGGAALVLRRSLDTGEFSERRLKENLGLLFNGSFSAIYAALGNVVLNLLQRPDVLDRLRDPALLDTGIDELLRFDGPAQVTSRVATRDTEVGGVAIKAGDGVIVMLAAANHDPAEFPEPDEIVLDRKPNRHLGFGYGLHGCVGQAFGKIALRGVIGALQDAPTALRLAGTPVRLAATSVRALESLPVSFQD